MTHKMILATADLRSIHAVVVAKRKAGEVRQDEHRIRNAEADGSSPSTGSNSEGK